MAEPLLEVKQATKRYMKQGGKGSFTALDAVDLRIDAGSPTIVTVAGESGSGKSTLAGSVLGTVSLSSGSVSFKGRDIGRLRGRDRKEFRRHVQAVFQDPFSSFNPYYRAGRTLSTVIKNFRLDRSRPAADLIDEAMSVVSLNPGEVLHKYPHQLSGGQRQRIMIARAYLLRPDLIVADEPVSMVDASLRSMILDIIRQMRDEYGISFLYITHDLATAHQVSDQTVLMYQGKVVEKGADTLVLDSPKHPYSRQLVESIPRVDSKWDGDIEISDDVDAGGRHQGCPFANRCAHVMPECLEGSPQLRWVGDQEVACYLYEGGHGGVP